jgi:parallel beta-helix repeat protein
MPISRKNHFCTDSFVRPFLLRGLVISITIALLLSLVVIVPTGTRAASIIEVDDDATPSWYDGEHVRTINEGIINATAGDKILVHPGTYAEAVVVNKRVDIASTGGAPVTIVTSGASRAIYVTASDSNITGFTITGGASTGISVDLHRVAIRDCIITGVQRGLEIKGQYATVEGCSVTGYQTNGIYVQYGQHFSLLNCTFQNTLLVENIFGASISSGSNIMVSNCSFLDNKVGGIQASMADYLTLEGNQVHGNGEGVVLSACEQTKLRNNSITGNTRDLDVIGTSVSEFRLDADASNLVTNGPVRYYVGQPGVAVDADAGYLGLVECDGVSVSDMSFSKNSQGVQIAYSDDVSLTNVSVASCQYGIYFQQCARLRMEGCHVNGSEDHAVRGYFGDTTFFGNCTLVNSGMDNFDDGVYLSDVPNATFYQCNISENAGYGIYLGGGHNATVLDCTFRNDVGGVGIYITHAADSIIRNNTVSGCSMGISVHIDSHRTLVENNLVLYNRGFDKIGIGVTDGAKDVIVRNNVVTGHDYGIWIREISGCHVIGNVVDQCVRYGAWVRSSSDIWIADNTFETTSPTYQGVSLEADVSGSTVVNNMIIAAKCAKDVGTGNIWNSTLMAGTNIVGGPNLGGNYYSTYSGADANTDGIGDTPFAIEGGVSTDYLPLFLVSAPTAPRSLTATPSNAQVMLQWLAPMDDGGSLIAGYKVYRGDSADSLTYLDDLGVTLSYMDMAVTNGHTYFYAVSATNAIGESPPSNVVSATPSLPVTIPTVTITSPANNSYNHGTAWLNWTGSDAGTGIAYYEVQLDSQNWINKSTSLTHTFTSLSAGQHTLKVRAWNHDHRSRTAWVTVSTDLTPPSALFFTPTGQTESLDALISVTMSETMATFVATVNGASTTVSWSGMVSTLTTATPLQYGTNYQVRVNGTDLTGWPMTELVYGFRTMDAPAVITCTGKVLETSGDPVVGATVTAGDQTTTTDDEGAFEIALPAGTYTVTATLGERSKSVQFTVSEGNSDIGIISLPAETPPDELTDWWWIVVVIVVIVILFFLFFIFWKRRKKDEEEEEKKKQGS